MPFPSENHGKPCSFFNQWEASPPPSPLQQPIRELSLLLSAGDDSGGGFPAGEEPARASLQGEGPAVLRGTQVTTKCSGSYQTEISKDISRMFLADIQRTSSEKKGNRLLIEKEGCGSGSMQTIWESNRMVDARWVSQCSGSVQFLSDPDPNIYSIRLGNRIWNTGGNPGLLNFFDCWWKESFLEC